MCMACTKLYLGKFEMCMFAQMCFYAGAALGITAELKEFFQHAFTHGEFEMAAK